MAADLTDEELLNRFEKEISVVRTRVDELVKLVKQKGEISFEDAAKQLDVSPSTIEAWANFLEEENIVSIKYNFTTPVLTVFEQKTKKEPGEEKPGEEKTKKPAKAKTPKKEGLTEIQMMLAEAYIHIKKREFDKAKEIYAKIKAKYDGLPSEFLEKKNELNTNLVRLSKELGVNLSRISLTEMEKKSQYIRRLLNMLDQKIKKSEILDAVKIYGQIKTLYDDLPDGFLEQKLILQNKIIELYELLITVREEQDMRDISVKKSETINLLEELKQSMDEKNIPLAIKLYEKIRGLYNSLPGGFLQEKAELQARIIRLYGDLLSNYRKFTIDDMNNKIRKIQELSEEMKQKLTEKDIVSARGMYSQIKDIFYSMPEGFLRQKTELQKKILNLYEELALELDRGSSENFNLKYQKIDKMLEDAFNYIKNQRFDLADELYKQIMNIYNSMPAGFLQKKTDLRTRILAFYKDISSQEALGKHLIGIPELKDPLEEKKLIEISLPQTKQFKPEKSVETKKPSLRSYKEPIPRLQIKKPMPIPKPKITGKPKTLPASALPKPPRFAEEKKQIKPIQKPAFNEAVKESKQSWFSLFKKNKGLELMPPKPPDFDIKKNKK